MSSSPSALRSPSATVEAPPRQCRRRALSRHAKTRVREGHAEEEEGAHVGGWVSGWVGETVSTPRISEGVRCTTSKRKQNEEKRAIAGHVKRAFHSIFNTSILETEYIYIYNSNHVIIADREGRAFEYVDMRIHDDWA